MGWGRSTLIPAACVGSVPAGSGHWRFQAGGLHLRGGGGNDQVNFILVFWLQFGSYKKSNKCVMCTMVYMVVHRILVVLVL